MLTKPRALAVVLLGALALPAHAAPGDDDDDDGPLATQAGTAAPRSAGTPALDLRYRYEYVADDATAFAGRASTVRAAVGYATRPVFGFSALGQLAAVGVLGPDFYRVPTSPTLNNMAYPTVVDPPGLMVDRLYAQYEAARLTVRIGRQELAFNNQRFLGASPWRQVHQTFDAAAIDVRPVPGVRVQYALTGRVNQVTGRTASDGQLLLLGHLGNATYTRPGVGTLAVYDLRLDCLDDATRSTNTLGARLEGPLRIDDDWSFLYAAELARQTDVAHNPDAIAARYVALEAGAAFRGVVGRVQYDVRDGDGPTDKLTTPLAEAWDGWSERFDVTPDAGLRTWSVAVTGAVPRVRGLSVALALYDYRAQRTTAHYGREQDLGVTYRLVGVDPRWTVGSRVARYAADTLFADALRLSIYTAYNL